jgi:hypothetical protein
MYTIYMVLLVYILIIRLPRDISYDLSLIHVTIILGICLIFTRIQKHIIRPLIIIYPYFESFYMLIKALDNLIQSKLISDSSIKKISQMLSSITRPYSWPSKKMFNIYYIIHFLPRLLLLIVFMIDIFYFNKIVMMYYCIWLGLIPLAMTYFIYTLQKIEKQYMNSLVPDECNDTYKVKIFPVTDAQNDRWEAFHDCTAEECSERGMDIFSFKDFVSKMALVYYNFSYKPCDPLEKDLDKFYELTPIIINLHSFLLAYRCMLDVDASDKNYKQRLYIRDLNVLIYSLFLITWLYVLTISLPSFHLTIWVYIYMYHFQDRTNPFLN